MAAPKERDDLPHASGEDAPLDKKGQLRKLLEDKKAQLRSTEQKLRQLARRDYQATCVQIAHVVASVGLFTCDHAGGEYVCDLGELEAVLKLGLREAKRKGRVPTETEEPPDVG